MSDKERELLDSLDWHPLKGGPFTPGMSTGPTNHDEVTQILCRLNLGRYMSHLVDSGVLPQKQADALADEAAELAPDDMANLVNTRVAELAAGR